MSERLKNSETNSDKGWSDFIEKNPDLNVEELHEIDPPCYELAKEFYDLRKSELQLDKKDYLKKLSEFGDKVEECISQDESRSPTLTGIFEKIRDM